MTLLQILGQLKTALGYCFRRWKCVGIEKDYKANHKLHHHHLDKIYNYANKTAAPPFSSGREGALAPPPPQEKGGGMKIALFSA